MSHIVQLLGSSPQTHRSFCPCTPLGSTAPDTPARFGPGMITGLMDWCPWYWRGQLNHEVLPRLSRHKTSVRCTAVRGLVQWQTLRGYNQSPPSTATPPLQQQMTVSCADSKRFIAAVIIITKHLWRHYVAPGRGAKYWEQRVCLSVCLSVCLRVCSHI